ncbi:prolyl oligopeptidase family serine peptidase [Streptomyces sp. NPDC051322]|uniref:prolyl oligopeptidase family serine peptidase n=1 Tax=Streptomyces sp. NPDC051322 TaxID=3154645 RepID=UPI00344CD74C
MGLTDFPRQFARTRRFALGVPQQFTVSPDGERVLFVRSASGTEPRELLWLLENGQERLLVDPPPSSAGVHGYATDRAARLAVYAMDGALWTVTTDGGEPPRRIPAAGPVTAPRLSPDGAMIAYVTDGALRVVRADGTGDRLLAAEEDPAVTYGLPDYAASASIGRSGGFWWSPDSDALLVARVDTSMVRRRYITDPANPGLPPRSFPYPAAGTPNAETSLLIVTIDGERTPIRLPGSAQPEQAAPGTWHAPAFEYLVAADWQRADPVVTLHTRDQRTAWLLAVDPATGEVEPSYRLTDPAWVEFQPGIPLHTDAGVAVVPSVRADTRGIRVGDTVSPDGLHIREVLGAVGERVFFTASEEPTETHVWSYDRESGFVRLTDEPGVHTAAAGGGTVVIDSSTADGRTVTVRRDGEPAGRIGVLAEEPVVAAAPVHLVLGERALRSRLHLPSWYTPSQTPGSGPLPVLLSPYAGPGMQVVTRARRWYTAVCQWFAEQGFAVLVTDGRGTPGRGVAWQQAIIGDRLGPVLEDQIDALHAAAERYDLDLGRVAVRGWSFGGYLAAGAVLHRPDVFHAAVAGAPPTDRRLYDTYWEERFLGHPDVQPEGYERSSLLPHAHRLSRPLMLVHGLADDNVAPAHTLQLSAALLAAGRPHAVLPLSGAGHTVAAREGMADNLLLLELDFLKKSLNM